MNSYEARNDWWVKNVTHFGISVSIGWKYLKAKHIIALSFRTFLYLTIVVSIVITLTGKV